MQPTTNPSTRLPVDLVTGFLGSGKTTLINAVLREPAFAGTLVIVNEFGEVGIDQQLFADATDDVVLLDSGCLCCAATGSLKDTLIDLVLRRAKGTVPMFSRVIVETSGLANPAPLVGTLLGDSAITARFVLHRVITLVDAMHGVETLARYREARYQVAHADRVVITKSQRVDAVALRATTDAVRALNPHADIEQRIADASAAVHFARDTDEAASGRTRRDAIARLPESVLRGPLQPQYASDDDALASADAASSTHDASFARIRSDVIRLHAPLSWDAYARFTALVQQRFKQRWLRCKGCVAIDTRESVWIVQGVQGYFARPVRQAEAPASTSASDNASAPCGVLVCITEDVSRAEMDAVVQTLDEARAERVR